MRKANIAYAPVLAPLWTDTPKLYTGIYGGRGGAKSFGIADWLIHQCDHTKHRVLATRQYHKAIKESIQALLRQRIYEHGVSDSWKVTAEGMLHKHTGSEVLFHGLDLNIGSIQSIQGITICWIEEAQYIKRRPWDILIPSIRGPNARFVINWNPTEIDDPCHADLVANPVDPDNTLLIPCSWEDNPWFEQSGLRSRMQAAYRSDALKAQWIWGGEPRGRLDALIFPQGSWEIDTIDVPPEARPCYGADISAIHTPTVILRVMVWPGFVYVAAEHAKMNPTTADYPALIESVLLDEPVEAQVWTDHQLPVTTSALRGISGKWRTAWAPKGPDSVQAGVDWLRSQTLIVDPSCENLIRDLRTWRWKIDPSTDEIARPLKHELTGKDAIDALRYAVSTSIRKPRKRVATGSGALVKA